MCVLVLQHMHESQLCELCSQGVKLEMHDLDLGVQVAANESDPELAKDIQAVFTRWVTQSPPPAASLHSHLHAEP